MFTAVEESQTTENYKPLWLVCWWKMDWMCVFSSSVGIRLVCVALTNTGWLKYYVKKIYISNGLSENGMIAIIMLLMCQVPSIFYCWKNDGTPTWVVFSAVWVIKCFWCYWSFLRYLLLTEHAFCGFRLLAISSLLYSVCKDSILLIHIHTYESQHQIV